MIGMFIGRSDSPMWKRGCRSRSTSVTFRPLRASSAAAVEPAGPPPTTRTSLSIYRKYCETRPCSLEKSSPDDFFETLLRLPAAKSVVFAACPGA